MEQTKIYCKGHSRKIRTPVAQKNLNSPIVFREWFLTAKSGVRAAGFVTFFSLVDGEVTGCPRNHVLCLKLPSFTWVRASVPAEELKNIIWIYT